MISILEELRSINKYGLFTFFICVTFLAAYINDHILITDDVLFNFYSDHLAYDRIVEIIDVSNRWKWLMYPMLPVLFLLKFFFVAICIYTGLLIANQSVSFVKVFHVTMISEFVFLLPTMLKIVWFTFIQTDYSLTDLQYFMPISVFNFFDPVQVDAWLIYPLQLLSVFEFAYWLALSYGVRIITKQSFSASLNVVASTYGLALLVWVAFVVFLSINATA
jgi:hypothetical protein